jgi:hypothetical protein
MHSSFTPVDTLDTSTYLHSVVYPNNSFALEWLMPVTGLQDNGQPVTPPGFDNDYGLYLTIDASGVLGGARAEPAIGCRCRSARAKQRRSPLLPTAILLTTTMERQQ